MYIFINNVIRNILLEQSTPLADYKKYSTQLWKDQNENAKKMLLKFLMKFPRRRELRYVLTVKVKPRDFLVVACTRFFSRAITPRSLFSWSPFTTAARYSSTNTSHLGN